MRFKFSDSFRDLLRYLISGGITKLLPFLLLPYVAHILNSEAFGLYTLYRLYITLGSTLLLLGLEQGIFRLAPELSKEEGYKAFNTAFYSIVVFSAILFLIALFLNRPLNAVFFDPTNAFPFYYVPFFILLNSLTTLLITFFSARKQSKNYLISNVVGQGSFFIIFLFGLIIGLGLKAFFYALGLSNLLIYAANFSVWPRVIKAGFSTSILKRLFHTGFPLMLVTLITYLLYQSDHYLIKYFLGLKITGIYNYGYRFAAIILIFVTFTNYVWLPRVYAKGEAFLIKNLKPYSALIVLSCSAIFWMLIIIFHLFRSVLIPPGFEISARILAIVGLGYIVYGHVNMIDGWLILKNKNGALVAISAVGLGINIVLNILFIPRLGITAAAVITVLSFVLIWLMLLFYLRRFVASAFLLSIGLKLILFAAPGLLLFTSLPIWLPFLLFLGIASWELRRNPLLPMLIKFETGRKVNS